MTITPEELKALQAFLQATHPRGAEVLRTHIDSQAARIAELENDELRQRLANAEHQIYMKELAIHNVKASRRAQFRARQAAEEELAALRTDNETLVAVNSELANELEVLRQSATPVAVPDEKPAVLTDKLIDWVCLTCVDVRNAAGDFEAQDSINEIRSTLESLRVAVPNEKTAADFINGSCLSVSYAQEKADGFNAAIREVLRLNSGSKQKSVDALLEDMEIEGENKPLVVNLPESFSANTSDYGNTYVYKASHVVEAIKTAGGTVTGGKPECTRCRDGWRPDEMGMTTCDCDKGKAISLSLASGNGGTVSDD